MPLYIHQKLIIMRIDNKQMDGAWGKEERKKFF
jgi:hypothetical protein